jgi:hypothetical protein
MKGAGWMAAAAVASALAATAGAGYGLEIACGMLAPLLAASVSWVIIERVWRRDPARLTGVMMTAFAAKVVFFGAYVAVMLKVVNLRPVPFVVSFTSYFIALYVTEAMLMRRLFAGG